jgi:hypothetical protein
LGVDQALRASALDGPLKDAKMCLWTTPTEPSGSVGEPVDGRQWDFLLWIRSKMTMLAIGSIHVSADRLHSRGSAPAGKEGFWIHVSPLSDWEL